MSTNTQLKFKAILALCLLVPVPSLGVYIAMMMMPGTTIGQLMFVVTKVWILLLPATWHLLLDRQPVSFSPVKESKLFVGAVWGVGISILIAVIYWWLSTNWIDISRIQLMAEKIGLDSQTKYLIGAIYWISFNSLVEEYVWRWFVYKKFEVIFNPIVAVILSAIAFTIHHYLALSIYFSLPINLLCCVGIASGGAIWSVMYMKYESIWPGYVSHAIVDVAVFAIGYWLFFVA
ncbi:CAAX amino terminal protease self- immunity [Poriferisphaera corsica]|uniref:CAAX amino terminal protease self-immunity n=1 Tax=Poriferisphaera corsica TaxID=2528020 RepID=A0A517YXC0_9BACT|nr:type II CAAX endopeptidase family protein [Poriferisphaera corsica]QDU34853.1 CAAX amino terminal protease self- immunity [Poriferisphaera corsica]